MKVSCNEVEIVIEYKMAISNAILNQRSHRQ